MHRRANSFRAIVAAAALLCGSAVLAGGRHETTVLSDPPAVEFANIGWSYTNITNPYLLTPDYMTNAMIGVSRLKPGQPFLKDGPIISDTLTPEEMSKALSTRLSGKEDLKVEIIDVAGRRVAHAAYTQPDKIGEEYAFALNGYVVHVLLQAKPGRYYEDGTRAALEIVRTLRAH